MAETWVNPFDANDLFAKSTTEVINGVESDIVFRSRDGGRTWKYIQLPQPDPNYAIYTLLFDVRQQGLWYVHSAAGDGSNATTYRTTNNGNSFDSIGHNWGTYCGISAPGVFRNWWDTISTITTIGVTDFKADEPPDSAKQFNWLAEMDTIPPDDNNSTGHFHALDNENYLYAASAPNNALITNVDDKWNPSNDSLYQWLSYIYYTTDDGKSWELIWDDVHSIGQLALDENAQRAWAISQDVTPSLFLEAPLPQVSLWKHDLILSGVNQQQTSISSNADLLVGYPLPAKNKICLQYEASLAGRLNISIYDCRGNAVQTILDAREEAGHHTLTHILSREIISGAYWLKLESTATTAVLPIMIIK